MNAHEKGKNHKRRVRLLKEKPYSHLEAEAARGIGIDNGVAGKKTAEDILVLGSGVESGIKDSTAQGEIAMED